MRGNSILKDTPVSVFLIWKSANSKGISAKLLAAPSTPGIVNFIKAKR